MKEFFKQYIPFYKNYKKEFFYAFIGIILVSSSTAATAYAIQETNRSGTRRPASVDSRRYERAREKRHHR